MSTIQHRATTQGDRWRVVWRSNGRQISRTFVTREAAETWRRVLDTVGTALALAQLDSHPDEHAGVPTLAEHVATHIDHLTGVTEGTRRRYRGYLRRRIEHDPIGSLPLNLVGRPAVEEWVQRMLGDGLSAKSVANHHSLLSAALRRAVRSGQIQANHAEGIRIATPDREDSAEMVVLSQTQVIQFIAATPEHWRPMVAFMFGTGVRWQEAAALQVRDVDLAKCQAKIRRAWKDTAGAGHQLGQPKSRRSRRTIVFGDFVARALAPLLVDRPGTDFVFTNTRGGPVRYVNFAEQGWAPGAHAVAGDRLIVTPRPGRSKREWEQGGGPRITPHGARHVYATLQLARGLDMHFVQRQLGHQNVGITTSVYSHLGVEDLRPLADILEVPAIGQ